MGCRFKKNILPGKQALKKPHKIETKTRWHFRFAHLCFFIARADMQPRILQLSSVSLKFYQKKLR